MIEPPIDPARLAALLDGRLSEAEREVLLAELAQSDDARELLGDTAAVLRELELQGEIPDMPGGPAGVVAGAVAGAPARPAVVGAIRPRAESTGPLPALRRWGALAAAAVVVVTAGLWYRTRLSPSAFDDPGALVASLTDSPALRGERLESVAWAVTRGPGSPLSARARAVRFGASAAELSLAARARDTAAVEALTAKVADLLDDVLGAGPALQEYRRLRATAGTGVAAARLEEAWDAAAPLVGEDDAWLGAWLTVARVAAARHDAGFFRSAASRRATGLLSERAGADDAVRAAAARMRAATDGDSAPDWEAIGLDGVELLKALGA